MKRTKREINSIIIHLLFFIISLAILLWFVFMNLIPSILEIEEKKSDTSSLSSQITLIEKKGVPFSEFTSLSNSFSKTAYTKEILKTMDQVFYEKVFTNESDDIYLDFLEEKLNEINSEENIKAREFKEQEISEILPTYSDVYTENTSGFLSDFKFINYVESILETFNLEYKEGIGIKGVELVEEFTAKGSDESLGNSIFYIPLRLTISGNKEGFLNFLHYIENVGKIELNSKNEINIQEGEVLFKNNKKIIIEGERDFGNYNMYRNQLIDIKNIKLTNYIDETFDIRKDNDSLRKYIIETQANKKIEAYVELRFYIKGVQNYKIKEGINRFIETFNLTKISITKKLAETDLHPSKKKTLESANSYMNEISSEIIIFKESLNKSENLGDLFKKSKVYETILEDINAKIGYSVVINEFLAKSNNIIKKYNNLEEGPKKEKLKAKVDYINTEVNVIELIKKPTLQNYKLLQELNYQVEFK